MPKKYWQLTLLALYACGFSYGENNLGAARTVISREANVPLTFFGWRWCAKLPPPRKPAAENTFRNQPILTEVTQGFANIFWIPLAMKIGRRPVLLITTLFVLGT